nr:MULTISPECIES: J domain-containing protein [unclassified Leptolyngbya]
MLGVTPGASVQDIRRAYRELSKLYHPDTTQLPAAEATEKFQELNEAYATLCNPERRATYDLRNGYSRVRVMRPEIPLNQHPPEGRRPRSSAYLDPSDRPLSAGEIFALFMLGVTFLGCLLLVVTLGLTRGDNAIQTLQQIPVPEPVRQVIEKVTPNPEPPAIAPPLETPVDPPAEMPSDPNYPEELPPVGKAQPSPPVRPSVPFPNPLHLT